MPQIRPISDLRNNFAEISRTVHESPEPVFLTKNGYGDMVVMSVELYEKLGVASLLVSQKPKGHATLPKEAAPEGEPASAKKALSKWHKNLSNLGSS